MALCYDSDISSKEACRLAVAGLQAFFLAMEVTRYEKEIGIDPGIGNGLCAGFLRKPGRIRYRHRRKRFGGRFLCCGQ